MHLDGPEMNAAGGSQDVNKSGGRKWDIEPVLDRLVLFRSDFVDHEVSQTVRSRKGARFPAAQGCSRAGGFFFSIRAALFRFAAVFFALASAGCVLMTPTRSGLGKPCPNVRRQMCRTSEAC